MIKRFLKLRCTLKADKKIRFEPVCDKHQQGEGFIMMDLKYEPWAEGIEVGTVVAFAIDTEETIREANRNRRGNPEVRSS